MCSLTEESPYVFSQKYLNKRRLVEILKDYHMSFLYHDCNANVSVDSLSSVYMGSVTYVEDEKRS